MKLFGKSVFLKSSYYEVMCSANGTYTLVHVIGDYAIKFFKKKKNFPKLCNHFLNIFFLLSK